MIRIYCSKADATLQETETLTAGMVNTPVVQFTFSSDWNGLGKSAIVRAGTVIKEVVVSNNQIVVPSECLAKAGVNLIIGVWGGNFTTELPTVWCACGEIQDATNPNSALNHEDGTTSNVAQMLAAAERAEAALDQIEKADWQAVADKVGQEKVNKPLTGPNGTEGQILKTNGDGSTLWVDPPDIFDEEIDAAIDAWLDDHPEATTTVPDHSLTIEKMVKGTLGYVTPEMFGAAGDGTTDDYTALSNAIAYAQNYSVVLVFGKGKTYCSGDTLQISMPIVMVGNGATIARITDVHNIIEIEDTHDIEICKLVIDGRASDDGLNRVNASDRFIGIKVSGCHNCIFRDLEITDTCDGEVQQEGTKSALIIDNSEYISIYNIYIHDIDGSGIMFPDRTSCYCKIIGGRAKTLAGSAITGGCDYLTVIGFTSDSTGYTGISLNGNYNICSECVSKNSGYAGFTIGHTSNDAYKTIITNCVAFGSTLDGIFVSSNNTTITNCKVYNCTRNGIRINGAENVYIHNIDVEDITGFALYILGGSQKLEFSRFKSINLIHTDSSPNSEFHNCELICTNAAESIYTSGTVLNGSLAFDHCYIDVGSSTYGRFIHQTAGNIIFRESTISNYAFIVYQVASGGTVELYEMERTSIYASEGDPPTNVSLLISGRTAVISKLLSPSDDFYVTLNANDALSSSYAIYVGDWAINYNTSNRQLRFRNTGSAYVTAFFTAELAANRGMRIM